MAVRGKAGIGANLVIIPHADRAPAHAGGVMIIGKAEMVARIEPAMVRMAKAAKGSNVYHVVFSPRRGVVAGMRVRWGGEAGVQPLRAAIA